jgi:hypothetical protein
MGSCVSECSVAVTNRDERFILVHDFSP